MHIPKVSIIVPIFNVEKYLKTCIDSLINQTYNNIEIILVNDGSPDNSASICKAYAEKDNRIIYIEQPNQGLSGARNTGIMNSTGDYILFVDSDDYIELDAIEILVETALKYDLEIVCSCGAYQHNSNGTIDIFKKIDILKNKICHGTEILCGYIKSGTNANVVWLYLYKMELIKNNFLYFEQGLLHEDSLWTPQVFLKAKRVYIIDYMFYHYVERSTSITGVKPKVKNALDRIYIMEKLDEIYDSVPNVFEKALLKDLIARSYMYTCTILRQCEDYNKDKHEKVINNKYIFKNIRRITTFMKMCIYFLTPSIYKRLNPNFNIN